MVVVVGTASVVMMASTTRAPPESQQQRADGQDATRRALHTQRRRRGAGYIAKRRRCGAAVSVVGDHGVSGKQLAKHAARYHVAQRRAAELDPDDVGNSADWRSSRHG
jgi:hypothetical protein